MRVTDRVELRLLWDAVDKWRTTECSRPLTAPANQVAAEDFCSGENHLEDCAVEIARQDLIATHNKIPAPSRTSEGP